jgi:hypothetical protein
VVQSDNVTETYLEDAATVRQAGVDVHAGGAGGLA